jgi:hypothetical protein
MTSSYWRIVPIDSEPGEGCRRVFLYGELDEIVGPMTMELAEAWIRRFDKPRSPADQEATPPRTKIRRSGNSKSANQQESSAQKLNQQRELVG